MGWMNDVCHYLKMDPWFRQFHHKDVTFSMMYAFSERFVLPLSHDEVVYMKGSLRGKMPGDDWRQLAGVRSFTAYMLAHPGKKLTFMGAELGQWHEWDFKGQLDWYLLDNDACCRTHQCIRALNRFYKKSHPLWENDQDWDGFQWLVADDNHNNVLVFLRRDRKGRELICVVNFSPEAHEGYRFGVPGKLYYEEVFNTDDVAWGGSGVCNTGPIHRASQHPWAGHHFGAIWAPYFCREGCGAEKPRSNRQTGGNEQTYEEKMVAIFAGRGWAAAACICVSATHGRTEGSAS